MSQRSVFFALLEADAARLRDARTDADLLAIVQDDIEERWDVAWLFQADKAWAGLHRCLTDGRLEFTNGPYPLNACVLGGEQLHRGDGYVVSLLRPEQVRDVAEALARIDAEWLRKRYFAMREEDYGAPLSEEDLAYIIQDGFVGLPEFFAKVAEAGRSMIFTVDL
jgi:uncharacterized protein DUF1877